MTNRPHQHNYVLKKETTKYNNVYRFYECVNHDTPCPKRDKMVIKRRKDLPPEK